MTEEILFAEALAKDNPEERRAFLEGACPDADLRRRVEELLQLHDAGGGLLDKAPPAVADPGPATPTVSMAPPAGDGPGTRIGPYRLLDKIGEGGMGTVYMAEQDKPVRRRVALKIIKAGMDSAQVVARFESERQALALMDHPNIARVLEAGTTAAGRPFFVMELVKGIPITRFCDEARLTPRQRLDLFVPVCQAVQHAHQKGIIHRDLKPSNILVTLYDDKPVPKVIDFGVAKATGEKLTDHTLFTGFGAVVGTLEYMSPEQARMNALDVDTRADIYSLGVVLYELLTGSTPFEKKRFRQAALDEWLRIIREEEPPKPSTRLSSTETPAGVAAQRSMEPAQLTKLVRGELDWIIMKALDKDRTRRYETANGLARDVQRYLADEAVEASPPSKRYRLGKFVRKHKRALATTAAFVLVLIAGVFVSSWLAVRATDAEYLAGRRLIDLQGALGETKAAHAKTSKALEDMRLANEQAQKRLAEVVKSNDILGSIFESLDPKEIARAERPLQAILVEKLDKAVAQLDGEAIGDPLVVAAMQFKFGWSLMGLGEPSKAGVLFAKARATFQAQLGPDDPKTFACLRGLAHAYEGAAKFDLALPLFKEMLAQQKAKYGPEHFQTLVCMSELASAFRVAGQPKKAVPLFEEALKHLRGQVGPDHSALLACMNNLAIAYSAVGKPNLAVPLAEESLKLHKSKLGPNHPGTLLSMGVLANVYSAVGKMDLAVPLHEEILKLKKATLGPDHRETLFTMGNLANAYKRARKFELALPLYEETLKLRQAKFGADHPSTLICMSNLANAYQDSGKQSLALPLFEQTLKLRQTRLGFDDPSTLQSMQDLASAYWRTKQFDKAIPLAEDLLRRREAALGRNEFETIYAAALLGMNLKDAGRAEAAIPLLEEGYRAAKKYPLLAWVRPEWLLEEYVKMGKAEQAAAFEKEWVSEIRAKWPKEIVGLAWELELVGQALLGAKAFAEAEPYFRESLSIQVKTQPNYWKTFNTKSLLGATLLGQKKYAEAEPLLLAGYEGVNGREKFIPASLKDSLPESLERLVQLYEAWDKPDDAKKWRAVRDKAKTQPAK